MSLTAYVTTNANGNITVYMKGGLNYENAGPLKAQLEDIIKENPHSSITLDMYGLDFVGSSGICNFVETLKIFNKKKNKIKLSNVKSEFLKVFKLYDFDAMETIIHEFDNDETENLGQSFVNRKITFQN